MDPKVKELLSKVRESAFEAGRVAGKFAGDMVSQAKLNLQIFDLNTEIDIKYKEIGRLIYAVHAGDAVSNEAVESLLEAVDSRVERIAELREKLNAMKMEDDSADCGCGCADDEDGSDDDCCCASSCGCASQEDASQADDASEAVEDAGDAAAPSAQDEEGCKDGACSVDFSSGGESDVPPVLNI